MTAQRDSSLARDLSTFVNNENLSDVKFHWGAETFFAHSFILAARSPALHNIVRNEKHHVSLVTLLPPEIPQQVGKTAFVAFLQFLYTDSCAGCEGTLTKDVSAVMSHLARTLEMPGLSTYLDSLVADRVQISNVCKFWNTVGDSTACFSFVCEHLADIFETDRAQLKLLSTTQFEDLLRENNLGVGVKGEQIIWDIFKDRLLDTKEETEIKRLKTLLPLIKFPLLPHRTLEDITMNHSYVPQDVVQEALEYSAAGRHADYSPTIARAGTADWRKIPRSSYNGALSIIHGGGGGTVDVPTGTALSRHTPPPVPVQSCWYSDWGEDTTYDNYDNTMIDNDDDPLWIIAGQHEQRDVVTPLSAPSSSSPTFTNTDSNTNRSGTPSLPCTATILLSSSIVPQPPSINTNLGMCSRAIRETQAATPDLVLIQQLTRPHSSTSNHHSPHSVSPAGGDVQSNFSSCSYRPKSNNPTPTDFNPTVEETVVPLAAPPHSITNTSAATPLATAGGPCALKNINSSMNTDFDIRAQSTSPIIPNMRLSPTIATSSTTNEESLLTQPLPLFAGTVDITSEATAAIAALNNTMKLLTHGSPQSSPMLQGPLNSSMVVNVSTTGFNHTPLGSPSTCDDDASILAATTSMLAQDDDDDDDGYFAVQPLQPPKHGPTCETATALAPPTGCSGPAKPHQPDQASSPQKALPSLAELNGGPAPKTPPTTLNTPPRRSPLAVTLFQTPGTPAINDQTCIRPLSASPFTSLFEASSSPTDSFHEPSPIKEAHPSELSMSMVSTTTTLADQNGQSSMIATTSPITVSRLRQHQHHQQEGNSNTAAEVTVQPLSPPRESGGRPYCEYEDTDSQQLGEQTEEYTATTTTTFREDLQQHNLHIVGSVHDEDDMQYANSEQIEEEGEYVYDDDGQLEEDEDEEEGHDDLEDVIEVSNQTIEVEDPLLPLAAGGGAAVVAMPCSDDVAQPIEQSVTELLPPPKSAQQLHTPVTAVQHQSPTTPSASSSSPVFETAKELAAPPSELQAQPLPVPVPNLQVNSTAKPLQPPIHDTPPPKRSHSAPAQLPDVATGTPSSTYNLTPPNTQFKSHSAYNQQHNNVSFISSSGRSTDKPHVKFTNVPTTATVNDNTTLLDTTEGGCLQFIVSPLSTANTTHRDIKPLTRSRSHNMAIDTLKQIHQSFNMSNRTPTPKVDDNNKPIGTISTTSLLQDPSGVDNTSAMFLCGGLTPSTPPRAVSSRSTPRPLSDQAVKNDSINQIGMCGNSSNNIVTSLLAPNIVNQQPQLHQPQQQPQNSCTTPMDISAMSTCTNDIDPINSAFRSIPNNNLPGGGGTPTTQQHNSNLGTILLSTNMGPFGSASSSSSSASSSSQPEKGLDTTSHTLSFLEHNNTPATFTNQSQHQYLTQLLPRSHALYTGKTWSTTPFTEIAPTPPTLLTTLRGQMRSSSNSSSSTQSTSNPHNASYTGQSTASSHVSALDAVMPAEVQLSYDIPQTATTTDPDMVSICESEGVISCTASSALTNMTNMTNAPYRVPKLRSPRQRPTHGVLSTIPHPSITTAGTPNGNVGNSLHDNIALHGLPMATVYNNTGLVGLIPTTTSSAVPTTTQLAHNTPTPSMFNTPLPKSLSLVGKTNVSTVTTHHNPNISNNLQPLNTSTTNSALLGVTPTAFPTTNSSNTTADSSALFTPPSSIMGPLEQAGAFPTPLPAKPSSAFKPLGQPTVRLNQVHT